MIETERITGDTLLTLPPEAGDINAPRFEPVDRWLQTADAPQQKAAMWQWFATHYESPATARPNDGGSDTLYAEGEPFFTAQLLRSRFELCVPEAVIGELVLGIQAEAGDEWVWKDLDKTGG